MKPESLMTKRPAERIIHILNAGRQAPIGTRPYIKYGPAISLNFPYIR
jgi:hypothetical protein